MISLSHDEIAEFAADKMRKKGYLMTWANMRSLNVGEQPDVMAMKHLNDVVVIEVKVSRSDFFADKKKPWRNGEVKGIGTERVYLTPPGLLQVSEIPYGWQLWEVHPFGKRYIIRVIKGEVVKQVKKLGECYSSTCYHYPNMENPKEHHYFRDNDLDCKRSASMWLISIMRRIAQSGVDIYQFNDAKFLKESGVFK
jgi:hypothetical protein